MQYLPSWGAEKGLRGVQPLPSREAERQLRGVQPLSPRQGKKQLRGVQEKTFLTDRSVNRINHTRPVRNATERTEERACTFSVTT